MKKTANLINEALADIDPAGGAALYTGEDKLVAPGGASMYTGKARTDDEDHLQVRGSSDQYFQGQRDAEDDSTENKFNEDRTDNGVDNGEGDVPFEELTDEVVAQMTDTLKDVDLSNVDESYTSGRTASEIVKILRQNRTQISESFKILSKDEFSEWYNNPPKGPERKYWNSCVASVEATLGQCLMPESGDMVDCYDQCSYECKRAISACIQGNSISEAAAGTGWAIFYKKDCDEGKAGDIVEGPFPGWKKEDARDTYNEYDSESKRKLTFDYVEAKDGKVLQRIGESKIPARRGKSISEGIMPLDKDVFVHWYDNRPKGSKGKEFDEIVEQIHELFEDAGCTKSMNIGDCYEKVGQKGQSTISSWIRDNFDISESVVGPVAFVNTDVDPLKSQGEFGSGNTPTLAKVLRIAANMVGGSLDLPNLVINVKTDDAIPKVLSTLNAHRGYIAGFGKNGDVTVAVISPNQTREYNFKPEGNITQVS